MFGRNEFGDYKPQKSYGSAKGKAYGKMCMTDKSSEVKESSLGEYLISILRFVVNAETSLSRKVQLAL